MKRKNKIDSDSRNMLFDTSLDKMAISCILNNYTIYPFSKLKERFFFLYDLKYIFRYAKRFYRKNKYVNYVKLIEELNDVEIARCGGATNIINLYKIIDNKANPYVKDYIDLIVMKSELRIQALK